MTTTTTQLSIFQTSRFISRFTSKSSNNPFYTQLHQSAKHIIASNAHTALYMPIDSVDTSTIHTQYNTDYANRLITLERVMDDYNPSTVLTLDNITITSIIRSLKFTQLSMGTTNTLTQLSYNKKHNEITLSTKHALTGSFGDDDSYEHVYYKASHVDSNRSASVSAVVATSNLINVLMTQNESCSYTLLEMGDTKHNLIKFENEVTKAIIMLIES